MPRQRMTGFALYLHFEKIRCRKQRIFQTVDKVKTVKRRGKEKEGLPRRVCARRRKESTIRLLRGRVPRKRHRSACKCASVSRKRVRAAGWFPLLSAKPFGFVDSLKNPLPKAADFFYLIFTPRSRERCRWLRRQRKLHRPARPHGPPLPLPPREPSPRERARTERGWRGRSCASPRRWR